MVDSTQKHNIVESDNSPGEGEAWLMSFLDVLTLLITFFVLMVSMMGHGKLVDGRENSASANVVAESKKPESSGVQDAHDGILPRLNGLEISGIEIFDEPDYVLIRIHNRALFDSGEVTLSEAGQETLSQLAKAIGRYKGLVSVQGHTDDVPISTARFPSNWELSATRATAVLRYMFDQGLSPSEVEVKGYADRQPLSSNETPQGRSANRRVEIVLKNEK